MSNFLLGGSDLRYTTGRVNVNMHVSQWPLKATLVKRGGNQNTITISEVELFGILLLLKCGLCYSSACFKAYFA